MKWANGQVHRVSLLSFASHSEILVVQLPDIRSGSRESKYDKKLISGVDRGRATTTNSRLVTAVEEQGTDCYLD